MKSKPGGGLKNPITGLNVSDVISQTDREEKERERATATASYQLDVKY